MNRSSSTPKTGRIRRYYYRFRLCRFELLEVRQVFSVTTPAGLVAYPNYITLGSSVPNAGQGVAGLSPAQVQKAYGFDQLSFIKTNLDRTTTVFSAANNNLGQGQTVAIIDFASNPTIFDDANVFSTQFGLPQFVSKAPAANQPYQPTLKIVNQTGTKNLPSPDPGWAGEITLDVEWVHAIAPAANILLVECNDLLAGVDYARHQPGVVAVSCSFGMGLGGIGNFLGIPSEAEFIGETLQDSIFTTPAGHTGITFSVSAGDTGGPAAWPSISPNVLSVGGTSLTLNKNGTYSSETTWNNQTGAGGGGQSGIFGFQAHGYFSQFYVHPTDPITLERVPSYQAGLGLTSRGSPDVSYNADPLTGVAVYSTYAFGGWDVIGGTSAGAPQWAALTAIVDQGRALKGKSSLANLQSAVYKVPRTDFHDITTGNTDWWSRFKMQLQLTVPEIGFNLGTDPLGISGNAAHSGYDLATGLGTPIADKLIPDLIAFNGSTAVSPPGGVGARLTGLQITFATTGATSNSASVSEGQLFSAPVAQTSNVTQARTRLTVDDATNSLRTYGNLSKTVSDSQYEVSVNLRRSRQIHPDAESSLDNLDQFFAMM